ncbi:MAG: Na/Pi cotransporter family protein [Desulfobacteraceae bacterium]|nr:Na/Pi cotransporter family protein [Desulfobacteraceae bacterium]
MENFQVLPFLYGVIGGLGLFLYGMKLMSDGLQKSAGDGLRKILEKLTSNRFIGAFVGIVITSIIQSSSATTVMVVGFVNAGLLKLTQALSVVLGANIGTTITGQIIAFKITDFALPAIGIGVFMRIFLKHPRIHYYGEVLIGFGMLFLGLDIMKDSFGPLKSSAGFKELFVTFSKNPVMAVMAGAVLTMIIQSSSATLGITMALAFNGILDFYTAAAFVLGENIGTTVTANLAAIGTSRAARRAALGHFLFNLIGVIYMLVFLKFMMTAVDSFTPGNPDFVSADGTRPNISRHIANFHTLFNIINTLLFLPFINRLADLCIILIPGREKGRKEIILDDNLLNTPEMAISNARKEVSRMSDQVVEMLELSKKGFFEKDLKSIRRVFELENSVDLMEKNISEYLTKLFHKPISESNSYRINTMIHVIHDLEKVGDYAESITKYADKMIREKISFSEDANEEAQYLFDVAIRFAKHVLDVYNKDKDPEELSTADEDLIDELKINLKNNHLGRLNQGVCTAEHGILYVDLINKLEKAGDNIFNIAQAVLGTYK